MGSMISWCQTGNSEIDQNKNSPSFSVRFGIQIDWAFEDNVIKVHHSSLCHDTSNKRKDGTKIFWNYEFKEVKSRHNLDVKWAFLLELSTTCPPFSSHPSLTSSYSGAMTQHQEATISASFTHSIRQLPNIAHHSLSEYESYSQKRFEMSTTCTSWSCRETKQQSPKLATWQLPHN